MAAPGGPRGTGLPSTPSCARLRELENDQTLLVQSGKPVGVFRTHDEAPRVLLANSNLVGHWSNDEEFRHLEQLGLIMYGQMTAGSWIYIGSQGILQGTFETFAAAADKHFQRLAARTLDRLGRHGRDERRAAAGGHLERGLFSGRRSGPGAHREAAGNGLLRSHGLELWMKRWPWSKQRASSGQALSVGLVGNCADVIPELARRGMVPDILTDQTSAHDALRGYVPNGMTLAEALALRVSNPDEYTERSIQAMGKHVAAMLALKQMGAVTFDYGNNIRAQAKRAGVENAFDIPGFVPEYIRPLFCEGRGPFRWVALSGSPADIHTTDQLALELFPANATLRRWLGLARERVQFQGLPARICWLGYGERAEFGLAINDYVRRGKLASADRDRARSSGCRFGGVALSRNRSHARRVGRHRRLAAAQRDAQYGGGRVLGFHS